KPPGWMETDLRQRTPEWNVWVVMRRSSNGCANPPRIARSNDLGPGARYGSLVYLHAQALDPALYGDAVGHARRGSAGRRTIAWVGIARGPETKVTGARLRRAAKRTLCREHRRTCAKNRRHRVSLPKACIDPTPGSSLLLQQYANRLGSPAVKDNEPA